MHGYRSVTDYEGDSARTVPADRCKPLPQEGEVFMTAYSAATGQRTRSTQLSHSVGAHGQREMVRRQGCLAWHNWQGVTLL